MTENIKEIEESNAKLKAVLDERDVLKNREALGGKTVMTPPAPKKEISDQDYAKAALRGHILKG